LARETGEGDDGWWIPGEILSLLHVTAAMSATPPLTRRYFPLF
jgi:hypothetical protein